ncbi:Ig-like domain repeat protein [Methanobrevibacter sp.]|uniref:Ig-like domain repeat protein n=1 Tax=Methanobrevibacter sp. TaxID=66852 RepID=UPI002E785E1B|nr:Ig-like domain repeat protein [Methanobrevibacter sp.]
MGCVSASEISDNVTIAPSMSISSQDDLYQNNFQKSNESNVVGSSNLQDSLQATELDDVIVVNNWDELQYYCSLKDKDYTLKLKDNTNFYPTKTWDSNYQIKVYNNVKIIGGNGSYIGDKSANPSTISYTSIVVPDDYKSSIYMENITFKWISALSAPNGLFIQMGGKYNSVIKNCNFTDINVDFGHASIVYLKRGTATLENCSFINCTSGYGCVGIYDPDNFKKIKMIVKDCYFEGNYATTAPGCINNCGILEVYNSTFYKNRAFWWAGAIHTHGGGNTTIYDSNFTDNLAGWNGGALYTYSYLQIYNTIFSGNNCTTNNGGGAIGACAYQSNPHIYIEKCLFEQNSNNCWSLDSLSTTGTGRGGAISFMDEGSLEVHDTTFIANAASIGTAICALAMDEYGSPNVIITNNSFINHTRQGDTLNVKVSGTTAVVENNYFYGNSIQFSSLTLNKISEGKDQAILEVSSSLSNPSYYDSNILDKTSYEVYVNNDYVKTVDSKIFTIDFDELDTCDVYVIPTISNQKSNSVHLVSSREYVFVSKSSGNDNNNGLSRQSPVSTIKKALELAGNCQSILIMDGEYSEGNLQVDYDLLIKGEGNATLVNNTSFTVNTNNFTFKNLKVDSITGESFVKQVKGNLIIDKCIFNNNKVSKLIDADNVNITKSIFTNNNVLIYNNGFTYIRNSILLNNTKIIDNNLGNIDLDYNWWGNTLNNISKPLNLNINNWLILNATSNKNALEIGQTSIIQFGMYLFENNQVTKYDDLIKFNLETNALNASLNKEVIDYNDKIIYTQNSLSDSVFTASYNNVVISLPFKFLKSSPNLSIKFSDIRYNDDLIITVSAPKDITGEVSVTVGKETTTKPLTNGVKFTFKYLDAGDYDITVNYNGNGKYLSQVIKDSVNVRKYDSTTKISLGSVNVGEDLKITVTTSRGTTGNVNLTINNHSEILTLKNVEVSYVFKNIPRGDYLITAYYMGDDRNTPSQDQLFLEVDNLNPNLSASVSDSNYGDAAVIDVNIGDSAAVGYVTASIDGITNSSKVTNGKSKIYLRGAEAGTNRNVTIFYSGDDTYLNKTITAHMNVFKSNFTFNMSSEDIFIGHDAVITIKVPLKTSGNFTINDVVLSIPMSGEVSYVIPDLEVGKYTITAVYNGNNYFTVENSTSFEVLEYPAPQWMNDGADTKNSQKTDYITSSDGSLSWVSQINSTVIANIVIDSEGNLYLATTNGIYSYDDQGNLRWIYESDGRIGNFSGLAIGRDVIISPRAGDTIYLIRNTLNLVNQTTGEKYGNSNIYQASSLFVPIIDADAFIYTVSEYQFEGNGYNLVITPFKIWEDGGQPIEVKLGKAKPIAPPSVNGDMMVVVCEGSLMIFDAHSLSANSFKTGDFKNVRPVIGDGNIVYTILGDSIVAYTITGSQYGSKIPITGGSGDKLLIDNELGFLYATNSKGHLYSYDLFTQEETLITDLSITSGILIDGNHNLYFASNSIFYCINSNGEIQWKSDLESKITSNPIINKNGVIYVTSVDNKLFALSNETTIAKNNVTINISADDVNVGDDAVVRITSSVDSIKITVTVNNKEYDVTCSGAITVPGLASGKYSVVAEFDGDDNFNPASGSTSFNVLKIKIEVTEETFTFPNADSNDCSVSLPEDATGTLTVTVDDKNYTKSVANGKATVSIPKLKDGSHSITLTYSGDDKYEAIAKTSTIQVNNTVEDNSTEDNSTAVKADPMLTVSAEDVDDGESVVVNVRTSVLSGKVIVNVNNVDYELVITNGESSVNISNLPVGEYTVVVSFAGDDKFNKATNSTTFKVLKVNDDNETVIDNSTSVKNNVSISVSAEDITVGDDAVIKIISSEDSIKITVTVNNKEYSVTGSGVITVPGLASGKYSVVAEFAGDDKFKPTDSSATFNVIKVNVPVTNETITLPESDSTEYSISLPSDATGTLTVTVDGKEYSQELVNGKATVNIPDLSEGSHNITVSYSGDSKYSPISKTSVVVKSHINATGDNNSTGGNNTGNATGDNNSTGKNATQSVPDEAFTIPESGSDYSISLPSDATGTLTVTVDGVPFSQKLVNGKATVSIPELSEGSHNVTVTYSGDSKYASITKSSVVVKEHVPVIKLTASNLSMLYTSGKYFKVRLTSDGKALPNQKVKITINGKTYTKTTDKNGYASLKISLPPKAYTVKATYGNLTLTKKVTVKTVIQAKNINAKKSAKTVKIKVTLKKVNGKYLKNKKVTLKFNKKTLKAKTNKKGVVTFTIKKNVYNRLKVNKKYTYQVIYGKDKVKKTIKFKK